MAVFVLATFAILAITLIGIHHKYTNRYCKSTKCLKGKTCIVTGGTRGMGLEIAKDFARRGAKVIIACPFEDEGINAEKHIKAETGNNRVIFKHLNLASLKSTRTFAADIIKTEDRIDLLVNNAGIGAKNGLTSDGLIYTMQINYYGHFLLTVLLLPLLKKTGTPQDKARIVNTTSLLHFIGSFKREKMNKIGNWFLIQTYANIKLCFLLFSYELAKRVRGENVVVNTIDPGVVGTTIYFRNFGALVGWVMEKFLKVVIKTPWDGCQTALHVALDDSLNDVSGEYFRNCRRCQAKAISYDDRRAKELWNESIELVNLEQWEIDDCVRE